MRKDPGFFLTPNDFNAPENRFGSSSGREPRLVMENKTNIVTFYDEGRHIWLNAFLFSLNLLNLSNCFYCNSTSHIGVGTVLALFIP